MPLYTIEQCIRYLGFVASVTVLLLALTSMFRALRRPAGREERGARSVLRTPVLLVATVLFFAAGALLWRPLPVHLQAGQRVVALIAGAPLLFVGLSLYAWGLRSMGAMFGPSSGFGVRLYAAHQLVTDGPYACVRHPMYSGVILAACGSLLLYRTWATLGFAILMLGLAVRARREEKVLAQEFGAQWADYTARVPAWLPRLRRRE